VDRCATETGGCTVDRFQRSDGGRLDRADRKNMCPAEISRGKAAGMAASNLRTDESLRSGKSLESTIENGFRLLCLPERISMVANALLACLQFRATNLTGLQVADASRGTKMSIGDDYLRFRSACLLTFTLLSQRKCQRASEKFPCDQDGQRGTLRVQVPVRIESSRTSTVEANKRGQPTTAVVSAIFALLLALPLPTYNHGRR
jgi:hypothetical protein